MAQSKKLFLDAALVYSMCGPWAMRTHPTEHFSNGTGQIERYTHYLNGLEAGATEYEEWKVKYDELKAHYNKVYNEHGLLVSEIEKISRDHADLKAKAQRMVGALEEVIKIHDAPEGKAMVTLQKALYEGRKLISEWKEQKDGEGV